MTVKSESLPKKVGLDTPVSSLFTLNWEIALYVIIFGLALLTRFYDLGLRAMSHDESLHTLYSWNLYAGKGYQHDPLMHGPFLFHATALMYFLFGDNDFTARIAPALLGSILVILPFWFRPWLGRIGGLSAAFMILISPGILYYSRYIRHDIFISVWTVLMVLALFQYMRSRKSLWLYIGAASVALMLSTKEISYIHGFIGVTFMVLVFLWENLKQSRKQLFNYILLGITFILIGAAAYLTFTSDSITTVAAEGEAAAFDPWTYVGIMAMLIGMILGALIIQLGTDVVNKPITLAFHSLRERLVDIGKAVLVAVIIWVLLHTTFFSNIYGIVSGSWGEVAYWLAQQEVQRGGAALVLLPIPGASVRISTGVCWGYWRSGVRYSRSFLPRTFPCPRRSGTHSTR